MQVKVLTTQNVLIHYSIASLGERILAYLIDTGIKIVYLLVVILLLDLMNLRIIWLWIILLAGPYVLYHLLFEIFMNGQGPGKYLMKIKVVRLDGMPPSIGDYVLRWIFGFVEIQIMGGLIAVLMISITGTGQRLGDLAAGTTVVKLVAEEQLVAKKVFVPLDQDYQISFPQVVQLSETDIELIQQALEVNRDLGNNIPVTAVAEKIKSLLGIQNDLPPVKFLYTVIKDFQHLTSR